MHVTIANSQMKKVKMHMLVEIHRPKTSGKIRKVAHPQKVAKSFENFRFYIKYAGFVLRALRNPRFQKFLKWIMRREEIEENIVKDVQVRVFPFRKENGNGLAGRCKNKSRIFIYPKRFESCQKLTRKYGKDKTLSYIEYRAQAALIHEFLHVKYASDEEKVRKLTKKYFNMFIENSENTHAISRMLFRE